MSDDPTRNERQRLYQARRRAKERGLVEVTVDTERWFVSEGAAQALKVICDMESAAEAKR